MSRGITGLLIVVISLGAIMVFTKKAFADGSPKELPAVSAAIIAKIESGCTCRGGGKAGKNQKDTGILALQGMVSRMYPRGEQGD